MPRGMPTSLAIGSVPGQQARLAIELRVEHARRSMRMLDPSLFTLTAPPGATPMSIDDLRANGPLGGP